jgi:hypothetical protein
LDAHRKKTDLPILIHPCSDLIREIFHQELQRFKDYDIDSVELVDGEDVKLNTSTQVSEHSQDKYGLTKLITDARSWSD